MIGKAALNYVCGVPKSATGGHGKFCLDKGGRDKDKATKIMTMEIDAHCKDDYSLQYDVPLNRFMANWDIKQFLTDYVGVTSWDDLMEDDKKKCFKHYPKKSLPDWDEIILESFLSQWTWGTFGKHLLVKFLRLVSTTGHEILFGIFYARTY